MNHIVIAFAIIACLLVNVHSAPSGRDVQERLGKMENRLGGFLTRNEFNDKIKDFENAIHLLIMTDDRLKTYWKDTTQQVANLERMLQSSDSQSSPNSNSAGFYDVKDPQSLEKQLAQSSEKIERLEEKIRQLEARIPPVTQSDEQTDSH